LLLSIGAMLLEHGFERVPERATFHRRTSVGWWGIHVPFTRYLDGAVVVDLTAMIRFDAVEELVVKFTSRLNYVDGPNRATLCLYMTSRVGEDPGGSFTIGRVDDVSSAVAGAKLRVDVQALPFFERFPTLDAAYRELVNPALTSALFDFPFAHERSKRVLAAAIALGRVSELPSLIATEKRRLADDPQATTNEFDDFARRVSETYRCTKVGE
jgi:hypothetical protein